MTIQSINDLAAAVRGRRTDLGMSQADLAKRAGVSRKWVYEFEAGKPTAELGLLLRLLDVLDLNLDLAPGDRLGDGEGGAAAGTGPAAVDLDAVIAEYRA